MTVRSESRAEMAASVEDVWSYVSDVSRWPEWAPTIRECRVSGRAPLHAGSRLEQRVKGMSGSIRHQVLDVSVVDAPSRLAVAGKMGPSPVRWGFDLSPMGPSRADVLLWVEVEPKSIMRAIPGELLRSVTRSTSARYLLAIKSATEPKPREGQVAPWL
jgi:ribosome-associated toxin RatA of RatAB toxin-antitoxin module